MPQPELTVNIKQKPGCRDIPLPEYHTAGSAGMDLRAANEDVILMKPGDIVLIPTGLYISVPPGYEAQVRPRSGMALKQGMSVLNSPGTIDSDYRGEIGVILVNVGKQDVSIHRGDRIAQMVISQYARVKFNLCDELDSSARDSGGFGSTGR